MRGSGMTHPPRTHRVHGNTLLVEATTLSPHWVRANQPSTGALWLQRFALAQIATAYSYRASIYCARLALPTPTLGLAVQIGALILGVALIDMTPSDLRLSEAQQLAVQGLGLGCLGVDDQGARGRLRWELDWSILIVRRRSNPDLSLS